MKKLLVLLLTVSLCLGISTHTFARAPDVSPRWNNILRLSSSIIFDGTDGTASGSVLGRSGTTSISGSLTVYRQSGSNWVYVGSTSGTSANNKLTMEYDFTSIIGGYYKAVYEVTVTIDGNDETETKTTYGMCN